MTGSHAVAWAAAVVAGLAGCSDATAAGPVTTMSPCASQTADDALLQAPADTLFGAAGTATGVSLGTRVYAWSFLVDNLCTASPVADNVINFRVGLTDTVPAGTVITGFAYYASAPGVPPLSVTLARVPVTGYVDYTGQLAGINVAPDTTALEHADLVTSLQVSFPTRGSSTADRALLEPLLKSLEVVTYYHPYIDPGSARTP